MYGCLLYSDATGAGAGPVPALPLCSDGLVHIHGGPLSLTLE